MRFSDDPADAVNLLFVARKTGALPFAITADPMEAGIAAALLQRYQATRLANLAALQHAAASIRALAPRRQIANERESRHRSQRAVQRG